MPLLDWRLLAGLLAALAATQGVCWLLARGLGRRLGRWGVVGGLLLPLLLLAPWLDGVRLLVPSDVLSGPIPGAPHLEHPDPHSLLNDAVYQFLPWELEIRHALAERRLPFWSDLLEGGTSPWANPQAGVLSPLQTPPRILPIQHHLLAALALKILVAFEGTWLLARRLGCRRPAAALAAAGFALGGGVTAWGLFPHTAAVAWVPWLTVGVIGIFRHGRSGGRRFRRIVATTAALTAALALSGHPETAAIGGLFAATCGIWLRRRSLPFGRGFGAAAVAAVLGLGLAAPQVLPFLHLLPQSQRAHETLRLELPDTPVRLGEPLSWFLPGYGLFVLAPTNPHAFGRPYLETFHGPLNWAEAGSGYTGLLTWAGALVALLSWRDRRARPFLAFGGLGLLLAAHFLPFAAVTLAIPPLRLPAYSRFLLVVSLALAVAGGLGLDRLLRRSHRKSWRKAGRKSWRTVWAALALAAAASLAVRVDPWVLLLWGLIAAAAVLAAFAAGSARRPAGRPGIRWAAVALLALALGLDLVPWSRGQLPAGEPALFYPRTPMIDRLAQEVAAPGGPYRAIGAELLVYPSLLPVYGLAEPRPHNPLAPYPYVQVLHAAFGFNPSMVEYFSRLGNVDHPLLDFLGVRAVVSSPAMPPSRTLERADDGEYAPFSLYRNPDALPRFFLPGSLAVVPRAEVPAWIAALDDPGRVALLAEEVAGWRPAGASKGWRPVTVLAASRGHLRLALPPAAGPLLATSLATPDGWRAWSRPGGERLPTVTVNGAFLGVRLPPGAREIELRYRPPGFAAGAAACALSLAICAALLWPARRH
jgi:hypothetical protein